jgi:hypothetical protein
LFTFLALWRKLISGNVEWLIRGRETAVPENPRLPISGVTAAHWPLIGRFQKYAWQNYSAFAAAVCFLRLMAIIFAGGNWQLVIGNW